jgi:hypothetical protein
MVVEEVYLNHLTPLPSGFDVDENTSYETSNGIDRTRHSQNPGSRLSGIGQKGMDALPEWPYLRDCAGQILEGANGIFHDHFVEPPNQSLV